MRNIQMETLKKTLIIPKNHQIHIDLTLPDHFPAGLAEILLVFSPIPSPPAKTYMNNLLKLSGSLKDSPHFSEDPLKIQKALRNEWER